MIPPMYNPHRLHMMMQIVNFRILVESIRIQIQSFRIHLIYRYICIAKIHRERFLKYCFAKQTEGPLVMRKYSLIPFSC